MSEEDKKDLSVIKDFTLELLGSASDKQKELILKNINQSIREQGGVITLEKTALHGTVFVVKSANFIVKNGISLIELKGHFDRKDSKKVAATAIDTALGTLSTAALVYFGWNPFVAGLASAVTISTIQPGDALMSTGPGGLLSKELDNFLFQNPGLLIKSINPNHYRYWPNYGVRQNNTFDIFSNKSTSLSKDLDFFDVTKHNKIAVPVMK